MTEPKQYRKKPVVIEAMQLEDDIRVHVQIVHWITENGGQAEMAMIDPVIYIATLEGEMKADLGDFIIRGVNGEFYPCKPDIFAKTYEEVEP
jgi:hypothetical protein